MKIMEFVELYENGKIENIRETLEVKDNMSFAEKYELCAGVLAACNEVDETTGLITVDSLNRKMTFIITVISMYTNLEFYYGEDEEFTSIDEYDMLCKHKLVKPILEAIGDDYAVCEEMLMTMHEDMITNNNTLHNVVGNVSKNLLSIIGTLVATAKEKIDGFNLDLSQIDIDKYAGIIESLVNKE